MKRTTIMWLVIFAGLCIIGAAIFLLTYEKPKQGNDYFTIEPEPWIEKKDVPDVPGDVEINVFKATRKKAIVENAQEDYFTEGDIISFFYNGFYKGNDFSVVFLNEDFYNISRGKSLEQKQELAREYSLMRILPEMNPGDGVIEGFILGKEENNSFVFYIFVDQDWKNELEFTNILWGDRFRDTSGLHIRPFDFTNMEEGIYIDKITEDVDFFRMGPVEGGIVVGEITEELLIRYYDYEDLNITFMMVR